MSYNANDMLERLRYQRDRLTGKTDSSPSIQTMLQALSEDKLNQIIDMIAESAGEDGADFVEALRQMDRDSLIDVLSGILQQ